MQEGANPARAHIVLMVKKLKKMYSKHQILSV